MNNPGEYSSLNPGMDMRLVGRAPGFLASELFQPAPLVFQGVPPAPGAGCPNQAPTSCRRCRPAGAIWSSSRSPGSSMSRAWRKTRSQAFSRGRPLRVATWKRLLISIEVARVLVMGVSLEANRALVKSREPQRHGDTERPALPVLENAAAVSAPWCLCGSTA